MCGQAGVIFGKRTRGRKEMDYLAAVFAGLLVANEQRGPFATGIAWIGADQQFEVLKLPVVASRFVEMSSCKTLLMNLGGHTRILMGHTRWPTRGSLLDNRNNHPIIVDDRVLGTHNGTIINADEIFSRLGLLRSAEVDSEVIFRIADSALTTDGFDVDKLLRRISLCRGQMSAIIGSTIDPETVIAVKGNKPLEFRYHQDLDVIAYASEAVFLESTLGQSHGWQVLPTQSGSMIIFDCSHLPSYRHKRLKWTYVDYR